MGRNVVRNLNAEELGNRNSQRVLVFGHGLGTNKSVWGRMVDLFSRDYRIIVYDLAFAGTVDLNFFDFDYYTDMDAYVADLFEILDYYRVERCVYIGHSLSAMIGMQAAIYRSDLFRKLILINASPCFRNHEDYHGGFEEEEVEGVFSNMRHNFFQWASGYAPLAVGGDCPYAIQEFSRTLFNMNPAISLFVAERTFNYDLRAVLGMVSVPCHIIQSARDWSVPILAARYLETHLGGQTTVEILDAKGHLPQLSSPALLYSALVRALPRRW